MHIVPSHNLPIKKAPSARPQPRTPRPTPHPLVRSQAARVAPATYQPQGPSPTPRSTRPTRRLPESGAPARVRSTNIRGTKYPMTKPVTGRHAVNLILAEDQLAEATEKVIPQP